jgi:hypothetical protein
MTGASLLALVGWLNPLSPLSDPVNGALKLPPKKQIPRSSENVEHD